MNIYFIVNIYFILKWCDNVGYGNISFMLKAYARMGPNPTIQKAHYPPSLRPSPKEREPRAKALPQL